MSKTVKIVIGIVVVAVIAYIGFARDKKPTDGKVIKVGAPLSLTGTAAVDALNIKRGIELAKEDLAKDGINVEVVYEDDGTDPKKTVGAITKLINIDKVDFLIGPTWSFLTDAGSPVFNKAEVVSFAPANTSEFSNGGKFGFYGATKNEFKKAPLVKWLKENNKKRVAIIVDKGSWGLSNLNAFKLAAAEVGAEVVFVEEIPFGQEAANTPTAMTKMMKSNPDVLFTTGFDQGMTIIVKKSQELNLNIPIVFATEVITGLVKNKVISLSPTDNFYVTSSVIDESFKSKFSEKYGEAAGLYADRAYDGLMLLVEATRNKKADQTLENYLRTETDYEGYGTVYKFDEKGDIQGAEWIIRKI